jgi:hypothetical protein
MKDFKPMVKMQAGGEVPLGVGRGVGSMGVGQASGPMGVAAQGRKYQPGHAPMPRVGYKSGKKVK